MAGLSLGLFSVSSKIMSFNNMKRDSNRSNHLGRPNPLPPYQQGNMDFPTLPPNGTVPETPATPPLPPLVPDFPNLPSYTETQRSSIHLSNGEPSMMGNVHNLPYPTGNEQFTFNASGNHQQAPQLPPIYSNNVINTAVNQYPQYPTTQTPSEAPMIGHAEQQRINRSTTHLGPPPVPNPLPMETPNGLQQNQTSADSLVSRANGIITHFNTGNVSELTRQGFSDRVRGVFNEARSEMDDYPTRDHSNLKQVFRVLADHMMGNGLFSWAVYQGYWDIIG
jgi:hypothetical protein